MALPIAFAQIDFATEAVGRPVLAILRDRGLEFRRVPPRPGRFFALLLTLVVLALVTTSLVIAFVGEPSRSDTPVSAYHVGIVVALIATAIVLVSSSDLKIVATDQGIIARDKTINWTDIKTVQRWPLFGPSIIARTGEVVSISRRLDGAQLLLDLCEFAVERRDGLERNQGSIVDTIGSDFSGKGAEFTFSYSTLVSFAGILLRQLTAVAFFGYVAYSAKDWVGQIFIGAIALIQAMQAGFFSYLVRAGIGSRHDRTIIDLKGVRRFRKNEIGAELTWSDMVCSLENARRLQFPLKSSDGKVTMTAIGMRQSELMDAVLEYGHAIAECAKGSSLGR